MFMRLVHARYKPESLAAIQKIYDTVIIPRLQKVPGCLFVGAIASEKKREEGISMTLWDTREHAAEYEKSGLFSEMLERIRPHLEESSEWHIQLSDSLELEAKPSIEEPVITSYSSVAGLHPELASGAAFTQFYIRLISMKIQPDRMIEFQKYYQDEILPSLCAIKGCRSAFLTESAENRQEVMCISIWDNIKDLEYLEKSGLIEQLMHRARHLLAGLVQWKMSLEKQYHTRVVTSEDHSIQAYRIVTGKSFSAQKKKTDKKIN